ncbi:MAG: A/G-specific adenine glycosylase [Patescibacteria group bacterium]|nr:A/G-specific adenine glycosylase [bacterium]MDZ4240922.1 A/G-specific adenine glycosylase [Patescibacteria group bacterium]
MDRKGFAKEIWRYYRKHKRSFPWRKTKNPYRILVSEVMLQQTQAERVIPKYEQFLKEFPNFSSLAQSPLSKVLRVWKGLGYNRRALYLKKTAKIVLERHGGKMPRKKESLLLLPGIGEATAGDILAFAWNIPSVVIETNIRSVFIHFFFLREQRVSDKEIAILVKETLPKKNVREWYYALMDYGAHLKEKENPSRQSAHHTKQSPFKGSNRQLRSALLQYILENTPVNTKKIFSVFSSHHKEQVKRNIEAMAKESLIRIKNGMCRI